MRWELRIDTSLLSLIQGGKLAQWKSTHPLIQRSPVRIRARSNTRFMDYDEACSMHLTSGVVHNFPKAVGAYIGFLSPMHKKIPGSFSKREGGNPGNSGLSPPQ